MKDMTQEEVLEEFAGAGALLEGHFILSSGRHSPTFLQKALVFKDPKRTERLCAALAARIRMHFGEDPALVVSPAVGGIIPGYETARALGLHAIYTEREDGQFQLRRGFTIEEGTPVIIVEDIVTTGLSSRECVAAIKSTGANVLGVACLIDRSGGEAEVGVPLIALASLKVPSYAPDEVPADLAAMPAVKPGSRHLKT